MIWSRWDRLAGPVRLGARGLTRRSPWRPAELAHFRDVQLRRLLAHAAAQVPFYRTRFEEHGLRPEDIRGVGDLARFPITSKRDVQAAAASDFLAVDVDPKTLIERRTSGSTGQPLSIRRRWIEERTLGALRWRAMQSMGALPSDRYVEIEEPLPSDPGEGTGLHHFLQRAGWYRQLRVDALQPIDAILDQCAGFSPEVVSGYAGVVARAARELGEREPGLRPRLVAVHSDTLTAQMRSAITEGFGARVFEIYDCNECNVVAWECEATGALHTCDDSTLVEVLDPDGDPVAPGQAGEIVLTALHSFAMPFIRYRIGDVVVQGDERCSCGSAFGTLRAVQGRMFDYFPLADGRTIHPYELINILGEKAPWISEFRLVQQREDLISLRFRAEHPATELQLGELGAGLREFLGPQVQLEAEQAQTFEPQAGAKVRVCQSLVASEYRDG